MLAIKNFLSSIDFFNPAASSTGVFKPYNKENKIISKKRNKKENRVVFPKKISNTTAVDNDYSKMMNNKSFVTWANNKLLNFYFQIINQDSFNSFNFKVYNEIKEASLAISKKVVFPSLSMCVQKFRNFKASDFHVKNSALYCFIKPLMYLYDKEMKNGQDKTQEEVSTFFNGPEEIIDVAFDPADVPSKFESINFEKLVTKILTIFLKRNYKWVSSKRLSEILRVNCKDFEEWANKSSVLTSRRNETFSDITYYGLRPVSFSKYTEEKKMVEADTVVENPAGIFIPSQDSSDNSPDEAKIKLEDKNKIQIINVPDIGTDEFDTAITQFFSQDKLWRSLDALATASKKEGIHLTAWLDSNPNFVRRVSKSAEGTVYYALLSRLADAAQKEVENSNQSKTQVSENKKEVNKGKVKDNNDKKADKSKVNEVLAFAQLHSTCDSLIRIMTCYANRLATRHEEAFSQLTKAQKHFLSGIAILQKDLRIDDNSLPVLDRL